MNETVELKVEKDLCDQLYERLREQRQDIEKEESMKPVLRFEQIGEKVYRVFNERTDRFHNKELGIDWVI